MILLTQCEFNFFKKEDTVQVLINPLTISVVEEFGDYRRISFNNSYTIMVKETLQQIKEASGRKRE